MTSQKLALEIEKQIKKIGQTPPNRLLVMQVLTGLALLTDETADPDCVFTDKVNTVLKDLANDTRLGEGA